MTRFVFSADAHVVEPNDLFLDGLPPELRHGALHVEKKDGFMLTKSGDRVLHRLKLGDGDLARQDSPRLGSRKIDLRLADMEKDGIDAEIIFPSVALQAFALDGADLQVATARLYNNWLMATFQDHRHIFVPAALLPVGTLADTLDELKRVAALGFTTAMLPMNTPSFIPAYNSPEWDPIFAYAGAQQIPFILHCGTGNQSLVFERGPGAAVANYTRQIFEAENAMMLLVAGGVLDRNPAAQVVTIEAGASWLAALSERMDEVYNAHHFYVKPKLGAMPSEIVRRQVKCSFQHDRACIMSRSVTSPDSLLWASDYPHMEGTFPHSRAVLDHLFDGVDISDEDQAAIIGGNAARLFRLDRPEFRPPGQAA